MDITHFGAPMTSADDGYESWLAEVRAHFASTVAASSSLFTTNVSGLWKAYLDAAPPEDRQTRTCAACRLFVERFGGLVTISEGGELSSALWPGSALPAYREAARALALRVTRASVTGVFLSSAPTLGTPAKGGWTHLAVELPAALRWTSLVTTAAQAAAAKAQERELLLRGLGEFSVETIRQAFAMLTNGSLYRSEKCEGVARWLLDLHDRLAESKNARQREHLVWRAVAAAPPGYCHVRSGMIGTLLEDLTAGELGFAAIKARFDAKMHPAKYLRPQAAPTAGNIAQAEKIVAALGSAGALARRFARLSDVEVLWKPTDVAPAKPARAGVFAHLTRASDAPSVSIAPATVMTWVKFAASVLPTADAIDLLVPPGKQGFMAMVTAAKADAPPMLQWDSPERRNPVSIYLYIGGSLASRWNLRAGEHRRVTAVVLRPWMWGGGRSSHHGEGMWGGGRSSHHGEGVCFVLDGARDLEHEAGGGMFPESMKSEYHPVRATLEAHFRQALIEGKDEAEACGLGLDKGRGADVVLRVTSRGVRSDYRLDRWD